MSVTTTLAAIGTDVNSLYQKLAADFHKAKQAWIIVSSPQTRAIVLKIGTDAIRTAKDVAPAVQAGGVSLTLDAAVIADIKQLWADAQEGDGVIASDLKALGLLS